MKLFDCTESDYSLHFTEPEHQIIKGNRWNIIYNCFLLNILCVKKLEFKKKKLKK